MHVARLFCVKVPRDARCGKCIAQHVDGQTYTHPAADCPECLPVLCRPECRKAA